MTDLASLVNGGPPEAGASPSGAVLLEAALDTAIVLTKKAAVTQSAAEAKDFAAGVLALAQATAVLDPNRDQQGIPVADQHARAIDMQHLKGQQELEREKERAKASAPTPRKVTSIGPRGRTEHTIDG
jgi:cell division septum initiation protein DivIVA